ncbi:MAG TPA: right-handed parallel beta-helix repeat-containing protein, partial [Ornithinibacter sp.]|nr:right-handed parallel beta-helix repeat-containing protein [Ornithinibacter sp.]
MSGRHARVTKSTSSDGRRRRRRAVAAVVGVAVVAASLLVTPLPSYASTTFLVTSTADAVDASPGDGLCATDAGVCTLRAAVQEANTSPVVDTVSVPAGTYALTLEPGGSNEADTGDLDVVAPLIVVGAGSATTSVVGGPIPQGAPPEQLGMDRLLEITDTAGSVSISGLTLRDGWSAEEGGAVLNASAGTVTFTDVVVRDSDSQGEGGGIHHVMGSLHLVDSTVSGNTARGGGGLYVAGTVNPNGVAARATLTRTTLRDNTADAGAGASVVHEGDLDLRAATVTGNHAHAHGGGVSATSKASLTVLDGSFVDNSTNGDGGGLYAGTESAVSVSGTRFEGNVAGAEEDGEVPDGSGGGLAAGGMGALTVTDAVFTGNEASAEGGGAYLDNNGSVTITDTQVSGNHAHAGAGIENAAARVTLRNLEITGNEAEADGGGVESQGSGNFTIIDTTISGNTAENGGGIANAADGALRVEKTLIWDNRALQRTSDDTGLGGGVYSLGDAKALYENVTIAGNIAQVRGGGLYVDADAPVVVTSTTIAHNSSPIASGVGGEIGSPNVPIQPSTGVVLRNTIVSDNDLGPNCSFAVGSQGGNLEDGDSCYFRGTLDRSNAPSAGLDAVADRGGSTMTMGITPDSLALDGGVTPCPDTDQRGVARPQNNRCDTGAFESEGPFPAPDDTPPDTAFVAGPIQDTLTTSLFRFTGSDDVTATEDLRYECRLLESDPTEPPEPPDPTQPLPPELQFVGCGQPWQVKLIEDGFWTFEARAIDRAGNVDPTPFVHSFGGLPDVIPPNTTIVEHPTNPSTSTAATFSFTATDNATPVEFVEFECRIDTLDPAAWLECTNPAVYSNLAPGEHTFQVRAADAADNIDPSPASFTWTVGSPVDCDAANMTLTATADASVDEATPLDNFGNLEALTVRSAAPGADARSLVLFDLPGGLPPCALESATLRLYGDGDAGRVLLAVPAATAWVENTVTWNNQPATSGLPSTTTSGSGYREFDVTANVDAFGSGAPNHGWIIRDGTEEDATGAAQAFISSEAVREPPTPPQLVLRFEPTGTPAPPAPPEPVGTTTVTCGQVITESVRLGNDLVDCMGEGLVVGAPNIVIDLNGHTLSSGLVLDPGQEEGFFAGIRNSGHTNVVVRGGTVTGFGYGVRLMAGATHNLVTDMTLRWNTSAGVELFDADNGRVGNTVRGNTLELNGDGIALLGGSEGSTIAENDFRGNLGRAVYAFDARETTIHANTVSGDTGNPLL